VNNPRSSRASSVSSSSVKKSHKKRKRGESSFASPLASGGRGRGGRGRGGRGGGGRGYNPSLVNYKDSEYHYGSDFEDHDEGGLESGAETSDLDESDLESRLSDDMKPESDVELEPVLGDNSTTGIAPLPFWLRDAGATTEGGESSGAIPPLQLPESSGDLAMEQPMLLAAVTIYEVLRQFYSIVRLSPFRFEDFCLVLQNEEEQSALLSEIHIALLKALLREDEAQQVQFGPLDQKDSMNVFLYFVDHVTWPENLRFYLSADPTAPGHPEALAILTTTEYPFTSLENRLRVLRTLTDNFLNTGAVRDVLQNEGQLPLEDHCRVCHRLGDMVVCEHCNGPFHGTCLEPPLYNVPDEDWVCPVCTAHMVEGVYDCPSADPGASRIESLGVDRMGNRYWFAVRRIWVEERDGREDEEGEVATTQAATRYYTTKAQLAELLEALDPELYERELCENILSHREDFEVSC
jgi:nucleosome-remodeling factor subunit BPTF